VFGTDPDNSTGVTPLIKTLLGLQAPGRGTGTPTYYFRTQFNLTPDPNQTLIMVTNVFNDGMVVYLNGQEVYRYNMPAGPITFGTLANTAVENILPRNTPAGSPFWVTNLPSSLLLKGRNYLAVEVHQAATNSSDVLFGMSADATFPPWEKLAITSQPQSVTVSEMAPAALSVGVSGWPVVCQWIRQEAGSAMALAGATSPTLSFPHATGGVDEGAYFAVVSNIFGMLTSQVAILTVLFDASPPRLWAATRSPDLAHVSVVFSETLDTATATEITNYTIAEASSGSLVAIYEAALMNGTNVLLTADPLAAGTAYILTVNNVRDASTHANPIAPKSQVGIDGGPMPQPVIPINAVWTYDDTGADFGTAWRERDFDDSAWRRGAAVLFNDDWSNSPLPLPFPANTGLAVTNSSGAQIVTHYFRHRFNFQADPDGAALTLRHIVDDGAVFYLNGQEVYRVGLSAGPVTSATPASRVVSDGAYEGPLLIPVTNLLFGENVLAVETHQWPGLLDVSFGAELAGPLGPVASQAPVITTQPRDRAAPEWQPVSFTAAVSTPALLQWFKNGAPIPFANHATLFIPSVSGADNGAQFTLFASNAFGTATSDPATLAVIPDTTRPVLLSAMLASNGAPYFIATFSKPLDPATATNVVNYAITNATGPGLSVISAALAGESSVVLTVAEPLPGTLTLLANGLKDRAFAGNELTPNTRATVGISNATILALDAKTMWQYNQQNVDLGTAWREPSYDDSALGWETGAGLFDGKNGGPRAVLAGETVRTQLPVDGVNDIPTFYFRTHFFVSLLGPGATMTLRQYVDDGVAYHLNGQFLYSLGVNLPTSFGFEGATRTLGDAALETASLSLTNCVHGTNLLAAEVHQVSRTSSDITFGAALTLNVPSLVFPPGPSDDTPTIQITHQPESLAVPELGPASFTVNYRGWPNRIQWYKRGLSGPEALAGATARTLTLPQTRAGVDDGAYFAVLSTSSNEVASTDATLTVTQAPPFIAVQPAGQAVAPGDPALFQVAAYGSVSCTYQWRFNDVDIPNATNSTYEIPSATAADLGRYSVLVSNALGTVLSTEAQLSVSLGWALNSPNLAWTTEETPWFTQTAVTHDGLAALQSGDTSAGDYSAIQTVVTGPGSLSFWWKKSPRASLSSPALLADNVEGVTLHASGDWVHQCVILAAGSHALKWNFAGPEAAWLDEVTFTTDLGPHIYAFPTGATLPAGAAINLQAGVDGDLPLHYQWYFDEQELAGATNATLRLVDMQTTASGAYGLLVTNQYGAASANVVLAVTNSGPVFVLQKLRLRALPGMPVVLHANVVGSEPRAYQWRFESAEIPGATNETLCLPNPNTGQSGRYSVAVRNPLGEAVGPDVELIVNWMSYVIHISLDGGAGKQIALGLEAQPERYPNILKFLREGASTLNARCDYDASYTVPNHLSMLTGRPMLQPAGQPNTVHHGYIDNWTPYTTTTIHNSGNPNVAYKASVFDVVHDRSLTTAALVGKSRLAVCVQSYDATNGAPDLVPPDSGRNKIDFALITDSYGSAIVNAFLPSLTNGVPYNYAFLHFVDLDYAGHGYGWGSSVWFDTLEEVDGELGRILSIVESSPNPTISEGTGVIVTADHGGGPYGHGDQTDPWNYTIPLLIWGGGFPAGVDPYTLFANRTDPGTNYLDYNTIWQPLRNGDTGNLALTMLGLPPVPGSTLIPLLPTSTPSLTAAPQGQDVRIEWSAAAAGFRLEAAASLGPDALWSPVSSGIVTNVNGFSYTAPVQSGVGFYRLAQ
jgi:hypothetical protein